MSEVKKSLWPVLIVLGSAGSFLGGTQVRTHQDLGSTPQEPPSFSVASIETPSESPRNIPEGEYFYQLTLLLERDFVDPNIDERKLAIGAVKGMIGGLWDPLSTYLSKEHYPDQVAKLNGEFTGMGIELRPIFSPKELEKVRKNARSADPLMLLPELRVAFVAPGGPADKAGMKVGDRITQVNGRWILAWSEVQILRDLQLQVTAGKYPNDKFRLKRAELQRKAKNSMSVGRATDLLTYGTGKAIEVSWRSGDKDSQATLTSTTTKVAPIVVLPDGSIKLHLVKGAAEELAKVKLSESVATIDLTDSSLGDSREIQPLLKLLAPAGQFGRIAPDKGGQGKTLITTDGSSTSRTYKLIVDKSTRGAAEILALSLKSKGIATFEGGPTAGEPNWIETAQLEDGSGYTLNSGKFQADSVEVKK